MAEPFDSEISSEEEAAEEQDQAEEPQPPAKSGSVIIDASVILHVKIADARFLPWEPVPDQPYQVRKGTFT